MRTGKEERRAERTAKWCAVRTLQFLGLALAIAWGCSSAATEPLSGPDLARRLGCFACHALNGAGGAAASRLDGVGGRLTPAELQETLAQPRRRHPQAKMPSYAYVRPGEMRALVDFLTDKK